jgi:ABC-type lipoprotein export system ATPase subunit
MSSEPESEASTPAATATSAAVVASGLYHIYRERDLETVALRGAAVVLPAGSWTSVMGPSGSGKSTLVHVMAGLLEPSGGSVLIRGEDITRLPASERAVQRRRNIGIVLQRDNLHPLLDVAGNVGLALRLDGRPKSEIRERTEELLEAVGLDDRAGQSSTTLSGGEAQRVAVAAAIAPRPAVLLADELTGELDDETSAQVLDLLETLRSREGTAILTVTHNPLVAERADRRLVMRDGEVVDDR